MGIECKTELLSKLNMATGERRTYFILQVKATLEFISTPDFSQPEKVDPQIDPECAQIDPECALEESAAD